MSQDKPTPPSEAEQRDQFELLAIRQEILARVCPAQEAAANDLETQEFSPRASHRNQASTWRLHNWFRSWSLTRARAEDPSLSGEHLAASSRVGTFRRTFLKSFFQLVSVGWSLIPPSQLFVSSLRRQCLQEVTHVM